MMMWGGVSAPCHQCPTWPRSAREGGKGWACNHNRRLMRTSPFRFDNKGCPSSPGRHSQAISRGDNGPPNRLFWTPY